MRRLLNSPATQCGLCLMTIAVVGLYAASNLRIGSAMRMGPGFIPNALAWLLLAIGALMLLRGIVRPDNDIEPSGWGIRQISLVLASIAFFLASLSLFGLPVATAGLILIASSADPSTKSSESFLLAVFLSTFLSLFFVVVLGLPMPLLPWIFR